MYKMVSSSKYIENYIENFIEKDMKKLWNAVCSVSILVPTMNDFTGRCEYAEDLIYEDIPCNLINKSTSSLADESPSSTKVTATLLTPKNVNIPVGSKISVKIDGETTDYAYAGFMKTYRSHREIPVAIFHKWA